MQTSEKERSAAITLYIKPPEVKVIIPFDSTWCSSTDGEWPSIILKLSTGTEYRLRPLHFANEDQQQITELLVEMLSWLVRILNLTYQNQNIQPSSLGEKIDVLITEAVTKSPSV